MGLGDCITPELGGANVGSTGAREEGTPFRDRILFCRAQTVETARISGRPPPGGLRGGLADMLTNSPDIPEGTRPRPTLRTRPGLRTCAVTVWFVGDTTPLE